MAFGHPQQWSETLYDTRALDFELNVDPDERVGPASRGRSKAGRRALFIGVLAAGTWLSIASDQTTRSVVETATSAIDMAVSKVRDIAARTVPEGSEQSAVAANAADGILAPSAPAEQNSETQLPPISVPQEQEAQSVAEEEAPSTESLGAAYSETVEPAEDAKDAPPKRKRAIAAGLDPDLPNVLLTRLSKADLRNAEYAIKTALAKTADDAKFSWPPSPSKQQAVFEVRFVTGAAQGCRRYIVTVTKDRWTSTSAALERCGNAAAHARAG